MVLPYIWAFIIVFAIVMYVLLDGFDLGVGMLFSVVRNEHQRNLMMSSVLPVWDGNETWMVFGAATLYGAFPLAYSTILPTLYLPLFIMLAALIFRGVAFEFRYKAKKSKFIWDVMFLLGSVIVAFMQGTLLATFVRGIPMPINGVFSAYSWLTWYSAFCGIGAILAYSLLGSAWLVKKTEGELQQKAYLAGIVLLILFACFLCAVSFWTLFIAPAVTQRWLAADHLPFLIVIPILSIVTVLTILYSFYNRYERLPFYSVVILFLLGFIGFAVSVWPYAIPRVVTFEQAAAPTTSLIFMLVGAIILLPILIGYSCYSYYIFRGKVKDVHEY